MAPEEEQQRPRAWQVVRGGSALYRRYKFPDAAVADAFTRFVIAFASYSGLPLFVRLNDSEVTLALRARGGRRFSSTTSQLFDLTASLG